MTVDGLSSLVGPAEILLHPDGVRPTRTYRCRIADIREGLIVATDVTERVGRRSFRHRTDRAWSTSAVREIRQITERELPA